MKTAFVERRPWAAAVVAVVFSPIVGMFYLGKGRNALAYLGIELAALAVPYIAAQFQILPGDPGLIGTYAVAAVHVMGAAHCFVVAKRIGGELPQAWFAHWYNMVTVFIGTLVFTTVVIRFFVFEPFSIPAASMLPTLRVGDHVFVSKIAYGYSKHSFPFSLGPFEGRIFASEPARGDIAVFKLPSDNRTDYIKRIVGLPGDRIQMISGVLHINGEPVQRRRIEDYARKDEGRVLLRAQQYVETLPGGHRHRIIEEAGDFGGLDNTAEYLVPEGHYFALGDNRDNSSDSRVMDRVGFVPAENLVGRLEVIFWNGVHRRIEFTTDFDRQAEQ